MCHILSPVWVSCPLCKIFNYDCASFPLSVFLFLSLCIIPSSQSVLCFMSAFSMSYCHLITTTTACLPSGPPKIDLQRFLSWAILSSWLHLFYFCLEVSSPGVSWAASLSPWGFHLRACLEMLVGGWSRACPSQHHLWQWQCSQKTLPMQ